MSCHRPLLGLLFGLLLASPAAAQATPDSVLADTIPRESNAPRSAFIKSMILPGWGQFSNGSSVRGMVWVAVRGSSYYMLVKTLGRLQEAKDRHGAYRHTARLAVLDSMAVDTAFARRMQDPIAFDDEVLKDPNASASLDLVDSRRRHRQDWITYTIFFTMLDAVDAYVAAHLKDFPADVTTQPGLDGSMSVRVDVPVGRRGRR